MQHNGCPQACTYVCRASGEVAEMLIKGKIELGFKAVINLVGQLPG